MNFFNNKSFCHFVETTPSSNLLLHEMVAQNKSSGISLPDFFCVFADFQTSAKAQGVKTWISNKGENILVSFYFQPPLLPPQQIYFNYFFALTIRKVLSFHVTHVMIKKPNDIYVGDKKIAGILIEHNIRGARLNYTVAGVGININQTQFDESLPNPVSLKQLTKETFNREVIIEKIIQTGKAYYNKLEQGAFVELESEYEANIYNAKK
jgi:BirA family biotin operon repressor/biotin-[acetyl-CoA-carboxylase] ligase